MVLVYKYGLKELPPYMYHMFACGALLRICYGGFIFILYGGGQAGRAQTKP